MQDEWWIQVLGKRRDLLSLPPFLALSLSLSLEIVYARLVVVVAKSVKSTSDRCAGRRVGVGQLRGGESASETGISNY